MPTRYQPEQFQPSGWDSGTPERKARFVNEFLRFAAAGFPREKFSRRLYLGLSTHGYFGFIAHYNLDGFYDAQLSTAERRDGFMQQLAHQCGRDAALDRPDLWSDVKTVLGKHLPAVEPSTARSTRLSPFTAVGTLTARQTRDGQITLF
jgi:hypothetical protein